MASVFPVSGIGVEPRRNWARFDFAFALSTVLLILIGLMSLYSQSAATGSPWFRKQLINVGIGFIPLLLFALVHPKVWIRGANLLYVVNVALLAAVLLHGKHTKGAGRWFQLGALQFQPSELAKLLVILTLATFYAARQDSIRSPKTFLLGALHAFVPMVMILLQPHLGAFIVTGVAWFGISILARVPMKFIGFTAAIAALLIGAAFTVPMFQSKFFRPYQLERILGMVGPKDAKGANYQTDRAEIAFGVGGVLGSGFMRGEQKAAGFIPEQQNDFILTVIGEEGGLVGCTLVLVTFGIFFYRIWINLVQTTEPFYRMVAGGIFSILAFHMFVNMAMEMKLLPVVGLWLPFLSYGGTAMWLCMACVGLMIGIRRRERPLLF